MLQELSHENSIEHILECSADASIIVDGYHIRFANSAFAALVGKPNKYFNSSTVNLSDFFNKVDRAELVCSIAELEAQGELFHSKMISLKAKRKNIKVAARITPIEWQNSANIFIAMRPKAEGIALKRPTNKRVTVDYNVALKNRDFFLDVLNSISQGITVFDSELRLVLWNESLTKILSLPRHLMKVGTPLKDMLRYNAEQGEYGDVNVDEIVEKMLNDAKNYSSIKPYRYERQRPDGRYVRVAGRKTPDGFIVTTYSDCSEEKEREEHLKQMVAELEQHEIEARFHHSMVEETAAKNVQLMEDISLAEDEARRQSAFLSGVLDNTGQGITVFDKNLKLVAWNRPLEKLLDFPQGFLRNGMDYEELLEFNEARGESWEASKEAILSHLRTCLDKNCGQLEVFDRTRPDGTIVAINRRFMSDGSMITTHTDVTETRKAEERARLLALRDELTGLANRRAFDAAIEDAYQAAKAAGSGFIIAYIDLDNFKQVNDTYGHTIGDAVLTAVSVIMSNNVKGTDLVARMGGDEFAIVFRDTHNTDLVHERVSAIVQQIGELDRVESCDINIGASAGISTYPDHGDSIESLIELADSTLYKAKHAGKGRVFIAAG